MTPCLKWYMTRPQKDRKQWRSQDFGSEGQLLGGPGADALGRRRFFENSLKNFLWKLLKCLILAYVSKKVTNHAWIFLAFGGKIFLRNFEKLSKVFRKFLTEISKNHYFRIFFKKVTYRCVHFSPFGRKTHCLEILRIVFENFWSKFNRKIEFLTIFGTVAKNRAFGNNVVFLQ